MANHPETGPRGGRLSSAEPLNATTGDPDGDRDPSATDPGPLPARDDGRAGLAGSGTLDRLVETARDYAEAATAENTSKAYAADWKHFTGWCRRHGADPLGLDGPDAPCPDPQLIGLYLTELAAPTNGAAARSCSTIERRLSGLAWTYAQRGYRLDRQDRHIATVLAGIRRKHARPPAQKEAILAEDILAMVATLAFDLRGLRDRAILLLGYAGGLRRSEIVSLDCGQEDTPDSGGWIEIVDAGAILTLNAKTGWREVEIGRGSSDQTCPVHALEQWLHFARIDFGPVFVRISRDGKRALESRLNDRHVARLIKATVLKSGIRSELPEADRVALFSGHSLRAGLASSAEVDERYVQKHLGHASAEMTRRYQRRRDRFRVNLTKAAGL
ncbi:MAG: tyrosine-type recombinase/integrase [Pseudomonadota bacterium]